jgi:peroxiredoxin
MNQLTSALFHTGGTMNSREGMNPGQKNREPMNGEHGQSRGEETQVVLDCCAGCGELLPLAPVPARFPLESTDQQAAAATSGQTARRRLLGPLLVGGLVLGILLSLVVASRGLLSSHASPAVAPAPAVSSASARQPAQSWAGAPTSPGPVAPDFAVPTLTGTTFHLAAQRGQVVILYFMATGCAGCEPGSTALGQALAAAHLRGVTALAIDLNGLDRPQDLQAFVASLGLPADTPLQWGIDTTGAIGQAYGVQELETTIVIDRAGQIAFRSNGPVPAAQLLQVVRQLA